MMKKLLLWPLAFLFALPGWASAAGAAPKTAEFPAFVSRFQELWVKHDEIRELRLKKLSVWIDQYYKWSNWNEIGIIPTANTP